MFSGIDDPQMGEVQTLKGLVHRFGYFGGFAEFTFNSVVDFGGGLNQVWDSRSKKVVVLAFANTRASVVFPHCLGPTRAVIGERRTARKSWFR